MGLINGLPALNTISILLAKVCDDHGVPTVTELSYLLKATYFPPKTSGVPSNFVSEGGVQQIQLRTEDRENGELGAVAP